MTNQILHGLIALGLVALSACQPSSGNTPKPSEEEKQTESPKMEIQSGHLDLAEYQYPFGLDLTGKKAKISKGGMGDCETEHSSYNLEENRTLHSLYRNCYDYGTSHEYLLADGAKVMNYHTQAKNAIMGGENPDPAYAYEEHVYVLQSDSNFLHLFRQDTLPALKPEREAYENVSLSMDTEKPSWSAAEMEAAYKALVKK